MPDQNPVYAEPEFSTRDPRLRARPHDAPFFWRLFGLYQRQYRPIVADDAFADQDETQRQQVWDRTLSLSSDRVRRYDIFEEMDKFGLNQSLLDVYAEETTQPDYDKGRKVWIESKASHMIEAGDTCLRNLQMEDRVTPVARRMYKYGDAFQRMMYGTGKGILGWRYARQHNVRRVEDKFGRLVGFQEDEARFRHALYPGSNGSDTSFPWDYLHFRLLGKNEEEGYGTGLMEKVFREWRYMILTEDSMLMYRIRRAPDRNLIMVDVGDLEDHEALTYVNQWRKRMRKYEMVDPSSPSYKKQFNPLTPNEDIFIPIRRDQQTRIETMAGTGTIGETYDLDHFRDSYFGAAGAPKAYFGFEGDINAKATLQQQDVRFARGCKRGQRALIFGLRQALDMHYTLLRTPEDSDKFNFSDASNHYLVQMSPISYLDEFERLELVQMRYQLVQSMAQIAGDFQLDARVWATYVLLNFAKLPEDMVLRLITKIPEKPATGGGDGFESLLAKSQAAVLDNEGASRLGFYPLTEDEKGMISQCVHESAGLRKCIANFAELGEEEALDRMLQQTDPSLIPPVLPGGLPLVDAYESNPKIASLVEDLAILKASPGDRTKRLEERRQSFETTTGDAEVAAQAVQALDEGTVNPLPSGGENGAT